MDFYHGLLVITCVHLLAAASPGPDFLLVSQQSLVNGRRAGILCSVGIALGLSVHIIYSTLGLASIIANSAGGLLVIRLLGGTYLLYLGGKGLCAKQQVRKIDAAGSVAVESPFGTVAKGFMCNVLNPKAPIYFVSLFTIVLSPDLPLLSLAIYGIWIMALQFFWFSFVALVLSCPGISQRFYDCSHYLDRVFGGAMLILGIKVITTRTG